MICPNCGKINALKADNCTRCKYNLVEIKANSKYCRFQLASNILVIMSIIMYVGIFALGLLIEQPSDRTVEILLMIILGFILLSVVLALFARFSISLSNGKLRGFCDSVAIIRLITFMLIVGSSFAFVPFPSRNTAMINARDLFQAIESYAQEHNGETPSNDNWVEEIDIEALNLYNTKEDANEKQRVNFAINSYIAGKKLSELPDNAVIAFETKDTQTPRKLHFDGIKSPASLEIHNAKHAGCIIIKKKHSVHNTAPEDIAELNWMNTDKLVLPQSIDDYMADMMLGRLTACTVTTVLIAAGFAVFVYLCFVKMASQTVLLAVVSAIFGGFMGWMGQTLHYQLYEPGIELLIIYVPVGISIFAAVCYCFIVYKAHLRLSTGYLRHFNSTAAIAMGIVGSVAVHLFFMLLNLQWSTLALIVGFGWGIAGGGIMGFIANDMVFCGMLKWQPCQPPRPSGTPPFQGGEQDPPQQFPCQGVKQDPTQQLLCRGGVQDPTQQLLPCEGEVADRPEGL